MSNAVDSVNSKGAITARLMSLLDDATRRMMTEGPLGVALTGSGRDAAVLGFMSLYQTAPLRSYAASDDTFARDAALRFGALHQTVNTQKTALQTELEAMAKRDGLQLVSGSFEGPGPFADDQVRALLADLPDSLNSEEVVQSALIAFLGQALARQNGSRKST
ncbi:hypothetical protein [Amylibacter sp. IMCC11727]|uniref:hypothetical protein n=1 Tax=Amylibacter sp. IMCC11727 TaxID=3039851 RepID=UPI00244DFA74|nr:hypothetical protein [Amylibacter sp. IMCC11727]WGI22135.1 hypothetical protein QBD29_01565 [Amylibacter sp. IMCC11727]